MLLKLKLKIKPNQYTLIDVSQDELDRFLAGVSDETKDVLLIKGSRKQLRIKKSHLKSFEVASPKAMTQRTIEIRSELMLQRPIAAYPSDKILWLNIRSPLADHPIKLCRQLDELPPDWCLTLRFDDIRVKVPADKAWTLFDMNMACKIAGFISQDWDVLLINCEAGVSRSAAVALAVAEHLGLPSPLEESFHSPNPVVLEMLRTAFAAGVALDAIDE